MSNLAGKHSLEQKSNSLAREVPHSTPEVDGNNGVLQHGAGELSNDELGHSTVKPNVIASNLQILDGERTV